MELKWESEAIDDRVRIFEYLYEFNPLAAEKTEAVIKNRAELLLNQPFMGVEKEKRKGRVFILPEISMLLLYEVDGELIRIYRVLHTKQKFPENKVKISLSALQKRGL